MMLNMSRRRIKGKKISQIEDRDLREAEESKELEEWDTIIVIVHLQKVAAIWKHQRKKKVNLMIVQWIQIKISQMKMKNLNKKMKNLDNVSSKKILKWIGHIKRKDRSQIKVKT